MIIKIFKHLMFKTSYENVKDEFVTDENLGELLERLGILTLKVGQAELPIFKKAESVRHDVKIFPGASKERF